MRISGKDIGPIYPETEQYPIVLRNEDGENLKMKRGSMRMDFF